MDGLQYVLRPDHHHLYDYPGTRDESRPHLPPLIHTEHSTSPLGSATQGTERGRLQTDAAHALEHPEVHARDGAAHHGPHRGPDGADAGAASLPR